MPRLQQCPVRPKRLRWVNCCIATYISACNAQCRPSPLRTPSPRTWLSRHQRVSCLPTQN
ncbi:hypothetical protein M407DRAFT_161026 [Tulasnella calospora MUT 4182]|uniref:Uncharacterized protein n=1 Tax=Tulasnella calospora MUT 4182 TaxID=1051891 RepID=A0A0C3M8A2_9AGAM|nr:hypothetical protein M407DRAFT_161026 [Tulasnella calospora MUT 4182]